MLTYGFCLGVFSHFHHGSSMRRICGSLYINRLFRSCYCNTARRAAHLPAKPAGRSGVRMSEICSKLKERGLIACTFPDTLFPSFTSDVEFGKIPPFVYAGFDPTADSLHVGHLLVLNALLHCYAAGVEVILLVGGATALLGDPSGTTQVRAETDINAVEENSVKLTSQLDNLFARFTENILKSGDRADLRPVHIVNNRHWYEDARLMLFMAEVGRVFRLRHLLGKEAVRVRQQAGSGMTFNEFSYQVFQAYDWLKLYEAHNCRLQLGGMDQIGNIHSGHDLIKYKHGVVGYGIAVPLLTDPKGDKFGKSSEAATVWLDPAKTSPFELYQFFLRLPDLEAERLLPLLTFLDMPVVQNILKKMNRRPEERSAQIAIAEHIVGWIHGPEAVQSSQRITAALFKAGDPQVLVGLTKNDLDMLCGHIPVFNIDFQPDLTLIDLVRQMELYPPRTDLEKVIREGGIYINNVRIHESSTVLVPDCHVLPVGVTIVRMGKKRFGLIKWNN